MRWARAAILFLFIAVGGPLVAAAIPITIFNCASFVFELRRSGDVAAAIARIPLGNEIAVTCTAFTFGGAHAGLSGVVLVIWTLRKGTFGYRAAIFVAALMALPGAFVSSVTAPIIMGMLLGSSPSSWPTMSFKMLVSGVWAWIVMGVLSALIVRWLLGALRILPVYIPAAAAHASLDQGKP